MKHRGQTITKRDSGLVWNGSGWIERSEVYCVNPRVRCAFYTDRGRVVRFAPCYATLEKAIQAADQEADNTIRRFQDLMIAVPEYLYAKQEASNG